MGTSDHLMITLTYLCVTDDSAQACRKYHVMKHKNEITKKN